MVKSLYEYLYSMNLFRIEFDSLDKQNKCKQQIIEYFNDVHLKGELVGPINIKEVSIDFDNGEIRFPTKCDIQECLNAVELIKFLPTEVLLGSEWTIQADYFLFAIIQFCIDFGNHPFEGKLVCSGYPVVDIVRAKSLFGSPVFVFNPNDSSNFAESNICGSAFERWIQNDNSKLKNYYITMFTIGLIHVDERPSVKDYVVVITNENNHNSVQYKMEVDGVEFNLYEGLEVFERHINPNSESNAKLFVVVASNKNDNVLALGNTSGDTWSVYLPDSKEIMVAPKGIAPILKGETISIGEHLANII